MSEIDPVSWQPVESWKVDAFLLAMAVFDVALIVWAFWFFYSKGWI